MKNKKNLGVFLLSALLLIGCNVVENSSIPNSSYQGEFNYEDPKTNIVSETPKPSSSSSTDDGRVDNFGDLSIEVIVTVDKNGTFVAEAEDCDTKGCTLQTGCAGFYEATPLASGGMCIACVASPSILAFSFELKADCTIEFFTLSAKYENPWSLDDNVSYFIDKNDIDFAHTLSSNGYNSFGTAPNNQWYNFKEVSLGSLDLKAGTHTMYIKVNGAFPNTDCFKLVATNYAA